MSTTREETAEYHLRVVASGECVVTDPQDLINVHGTVEFLARAPVGSEQKVCEGTRNSADE